MIVALASTAIFFYYSISQKEAQLKDLQADLAVALANTTTKMQQLRVLTPRVTSDSNRIVQAGTPRSAEETSNIRTGNGPQRHSEVQLEDTSGEDADDFYEVEPRRGSRNVKIVATVTVILLITMAVLVSFVNHNVYGSGRHMTGNGRHVTGTGMNQRSMDYERHASDLPTINRKRNPFYPAIVVVVVEELESNRSIEFNRSIENSTETAWPPLALYGYANSSMEPEMDLLVT